MAGSGTDFGRLGRCIPVVFFLVVGLVPSTAFGESVDFSGEVSSSFGVFLLSCLPNCEFVDYQNRNIVDVGVDADLGYDVDARAGISLRNDNTPRIDRAGDTADITNVQPIRLRITEAWVEGYDLGVSGLDVRVGSQKIRWGTGLRFSPSDRLNPYDLSDPTHFDRRLATPAVRASYIVSSLTVTAAWFPFFVPSLLNSRIVDTLTDAEIDDDTHFGDDVDGDLPEVERVSTRVGLPSQTIADSSFALRTDWAASFADIAIGYFYGRDNLPQLSGEVIPENFFDGESTDLIVNLAYPPMQMLAADVSAPFFESWTGWIDAALVFPSRTEIYISQSRLEDLERLGAIDEAPDEDVTATTQSGRPYLNFMVGADTSIGSSVYLNFQYLHGFLFERNPEDLHHYGLVGLTAPATIAPSFEFEAVAGVEANRSFDAYGLLNQLRVKYRPADALELNAAASLQLGQEGTTVGAFRNLSELRVGAKGFF